MAVAAGLVISRRAALGTAAFHDPRTIDSAEFARMAPEKLDAFARAGSALLQEYWSIGRDVVELVAAQTRATTGLAFEVGLLPTPLHAASAQARYVGDLFENAAERGASIAMRTLNAGGVAMRPIHRRATANARRLARRRA
jgi:hypothetical protein